MTSSPPHAAEYAPVVWLSESRAPIPVAHRLRLLLALSLTVAALGVWLWLGDFNALAAIGYLPIVIVRSVTGHLDGVTFSALVSWPVLRSFLVVLGGLALLAGAVRAWSPVAAFARMSGHRLRVMTTALVTVAVAVPLGYAATRLGWALGIPVGVSADFLAQIRPIVYNGLGLAVMALGGALLTVGLLRPWGEVFPRWIPGLGGRQVAIGFAVSFALAVSALLMVAGLFFVRSLLTGAALAGAPSGAADQPAAWLPELFWPLWSLALAGSALGYLVRRQRAAGAEHSRPRS